MSAKDKHTGLEDLAFTEIHFFFLSKRNMLVSREFICKALCLSAANSEAQETGHLNCSRLDYRGKTAFVLPPPFFFLSSTAIFHFQKTSLVRDLHVNLDGVCFCSSHEVGFIKDHHQSLCKSMWASGPAVGASWVTSLFGSHICLWGRAAESRDRQLASNHDRDHMKAIKSDTNQILIHPPVLRMFISKGGNGWDNYNTHAHTHAPLNSIHTKHNHVIFLRPFLSACFFHVWAWLSADVRVWRERKEAEENMVCVKKQKDEKSFIFFSVYITK